MDHFINFDPYMIGEHNRQLRKEVDSLRKNRKVRRSSRPFALIERAGSLSLMRDWLGSTLVVSRSGDPFRRGADTELQAQMASSKKVEKERYGHCDE
jgi:glycosyltransferase A (GT-A) superfamily protein (DUF2064 family)